MMNEEELIRLAQQITDGVLLDHPVDLSLREFRHFYEFFIEINGRKIPNVTAIHLGDQVQLIFPKHSRQEIIIQPEKKRHILREDFDFVPFINWRGARRPAPGFFQFLREEIRISRFRVGLTFILQQRYYLSVHPYLQLWT
jgi:hypothetical protein